MLTLLSLLGMVAIIGFAWLLSSNRQKFPWRIVLMGLLLQFALGFLILKTKLGNAAFDKAQSVVDQLINFSNEGSKVVFGALANTESMGPVFGPGNKVVFAIMVTATIILISAISSLLYHYNILQRFVRGMALIMRHLMGTSGSETFAAAANVFMGQTEAPLVVKPYLERMTRSELYALMVGGMASIAGGVLAVYVSFGIDAGHLLTASFMSAPASLLIAKILIPETEVSETTAGANAETEKTSANGIDAICHGATEGMMLSINVIAMIIAFVAIVAMANYLLGWILSPFGVQWTLQTFFGWINAPFALLMGIPPQDCIAVGKVLGERIVLNEFIAYLSLAEIKESLDPRSYVLATYALCGFANFGSIAIQIGGIGALAPSRRGDLARLGMRAMIGGLLSCYLTATVIGIIGDQKMFTLVR